MKKSKKNLINEQIRAEQVRLIDEEGTQKGVVSTTEALALAQSKNLDLVALGDDGEVPVCRLMDYGKHRYEQTKKVAAQRKKQRQLQVTKEIKMRPGTGEGDIMIKLQKIMGFLELGHRVKVTIRFRGRELSHKDLGLALLHRVEKDLAELATVEQHPRLEGKQMSMLFVSKKK